MKSRLAAPTFLLCALSLGLLGACVERALDGEPVLAVVDLGRPGSDAGGPSLDLASPGPTDLASADLVATVGVACDTQTCSTSEICCPLSGKPAACVPVMGIGNNACPFGEGWRCDGPEDCQDNRICYGNQFDPDVYGSPGRTRCRPVQMVGGDYRIICRQDSDCMGGFVCRPNETTIPGAPAVSTCRFWQE